MGHGATTNHVKVSGQAVLSTGCDFPSPLQSQYSFPRAMMSHGGCPLIALESNREASGDVHEYLIMTVVD